MKPNGILTAAFAVAAIMAIGVRQAPAQDWIPAGVPANFWTSVACSADGTILVAAAQGPIYVSTNGGSSWLATAAPGNSWNSVACSADGARLAAAALYGPIYISTDFGATWNPSSGLLTNWFCVASSAKGDTLLASSAYYNYVYYSTNSGATWSQADLPAFAPWSSVACSADGTKLVAGAFSDRLWASTNSGASWHPLGSAFGYWNCIATSADGTRLMAVSDAFSEFSSPAYAWASADSGATWSVTISPCHMGMVIPEGVQQPHLVVAGSAEGTKWVGAACPGQIYTSLDLGATWVTNNTPTTNWSAIASSADGHKLVTVVKGGLVYTSQSAPEPKLKIADSGSDLLLSWVVPSRSFVLQQRGSLSTGDWVDIATNFTLNYTNLTYEVSAPKSAAVTFYRLLSRGTTAQDGSARVPSKEHRGEAAGRHVQAF